jgi:hypothetical protein
MNPDKALARPGYAIALFLFILPLTDATMTLWPTLNLGSEQWRFGAIGTISNLTLIPLLGLLVALALAVWYDHRHVRRFIGWFTAVIAVVFACCAVLFVLDYFQTRAVTRPEYMERMAIATVTSLIKQALTIIALILLSRAALSGPKPAKKSSRAAARKEPTPLIPQSDAVRSE